jgi:hypothetical protein
MLSAWVDVTTGVTGTNGFVLKVQYSYFDGFYEISRFFHYVRPQKFRVSLSLSTTTATSDSFYGAAFAFYPVNYIKESYTMQIPGNVSSLMALPGSVLVQPGGRNLGPWRNLAEKEWFSCADINQSAAALGSALAYCSDLGISESLGVMVIEVVFEFKAKIFWSGSLLTHGEKKEGSKAIASVTSTEKIEETKTDTSVLIKKKN